MPPIKDWPHAPIHRINSDGIYMVTGATLHKERVFPTADKLDMLERELLTLAKQHEWQLEAWAVFVNHYHIVARGHDPTRPLDKFLKHLHSNTARQVNELDDSAGRQVWHNFWETELTYERSYLARLNYVHQNAVKLWSVWQISIAGVQPPGLNVPLRRQQSKPFMDSKSTS